MDGRGRAGGEIAMTETDSGTRVATTIAITMTISQPKMITTLGQGEVHI